MEHRIKIFKAFLSTTDKEIENLENAIEEAKEKKHSLVVTNFYNLFKESKILSTFEYRLYLQYDRPTLRISLNSEEGRQILELIEIAHQLDKKLGCRNVKLSENLFGELIETGKYIKTESDHGNFEPGWYVDIDLSQYYEFAELISELKDLGFVKIFPELWKYEIDRLKKVKKDCDDKITQLKGDLLKAETK